MFKVLTGETRRRVISPATLAASVAAHLLLLGGLVYASTGEHEPKEVVGTVEVLPPLPPEPEAPPVAPVQPRPTPRVEPTKAPSPVTVLTLPPVEKVPTVIPVEAPNVAPVDPRLFRGDGPTGTVLVPPATKPTEPSAGDGEGGTGVEPYRMEMVEVRPVLERTGLSRILERNYPAVLRDSRVSGRVVIEMVVDEDGVPVPGSARVIEASHPAFGEATLRVADRFRFRPARHNGKAVPVVVTIPIVWTSN